MKINENTKPTVHKQLQIKGMICESCEKIIEKSVSKLDGIKHIEVNYRKGTAKIDYNPKQITLEEIGYKIKEAGYGSDIDEKETKSNSKKSLKDNKPALIAICIVVLLLAIMSYFTLSNALDKMNIAIPTLDANTSAVIIFFVGLLTGFHCIGMCGSFVLSYTAKARAENPKSLNLGLHGQYALGKTISYTLIGGAFGIIGSIFVFSNELRAIIAILAGIFLILFGLRMLNVHPILRKLTIPQGIFDKLQIGPLKKSSNPLAIGLANGLFIACGPLQAMYIIAMASGSFIGGATILFAFAIGTLIPMLGFGVFASLISHTMQNNIVKISAIIVLIMGIFMINNGLALTGNQISAATFTTINGVGTNNNEQNLSITHASAEGTSTGPGYQIIRMDVTNAGYTPNSFILKTGVPVRWIVNGKQINGCNGTIIVPSYNIKFNVKQGEQTINFTPTKSGVINFSCWMGMIQGNFVVRDDVSIDASGNVITTQQIQQAVSKQVATAPKAKSGCGCGGGSAQTCH